MEPFTRLTALAAPLPEANIDTDIILPARFLLVTEKLGLGRFAFYERREGGGFVLDDTRYKGAQILVAGENFGCGSSREQAPWALRDLDIRCIIAPSFGEIFRANCARNGMLAITLADPEWTSVIHVAQAGEAMTIDLAERLILLPDGTSIPFAIADATREALLHGWDEIDGIRAQYRDAITQFEQSQSLSAPWLWQKEQSNG